MMPSDNCFKMYFKLHFELYWRSSHHFSFVCLHKTVLSKYGSKCHARPRHTTPPQMRIPLTLFDVFRPIRVNVPTLRKLKGNLQHCFIVLGEMADANNDEIFHKGKKIQEYSLAFKKEVIAYAEARGNQPASKQFSIVEKRVWEWRAQKSNIEGLLGSTKGKQRSRLSGGGRKPLSAKLEELLLEWIENRRARGLRVSCKLITWRKEKLLIVIWWKTT